MTAGTFYLEAGEGVDPLEHIVHRLSDFVVTRELGALARHPIDELAHQWRDVAAPRRNSERALI